MNEQTIIMQIRKNVNTKYLLSQYKNKHSCNLNFGTAILN